VVTEPNPTGRGRPEPGQPPLLPGVILLIVAALLIIVVLIKPSMPGWLRTVIAIVAVLVVLALLVYAYRVFRGSTRRGAS
jgi:hypothetical protein